MAKITSKQVIKVIKDKEKSEEKINVTFRLNQELLNRFREKCQREKVAMAAVIEIMITDFVEN